MKKNLFYTAILMIAFPMIFSSCTKEQSALNALYGTWIVEEVLDSDGDVVPQNGTSGFPAGTYTQETEVTFYRCNDKEEESCIGTTKRTRNYTYNDGTTDTDIDAGEFQYNIFGKDEFLLGGQVMEIEKLTKKEFRFYPASAPKAVTTYTR